jgi:formylglycine-generating enzyme required for sulfatase activity
VCEADCNGNSLPDSWEISQGLAPDCNANGKPDVCDVASGGGSADLDQNGVPDECQADCNGNDLPDSYEIAAGLVPDCNGNGVLDTCDVASNPSLDCNGNGVPDSCEIASNPSLDCNGNGSIDSCEIASNPSLDCNGNGVPDSCDIASNPSLDCNGNGVHDVCDLMAGGEDENANGALDSCELAYGDLDLDGIIGGGDLAVFLSVWGFEGAPYGDLSGDGIVDGQDLAMLLTAWGQTPWQAPEGPQWATVVGWYPTAQIVPDAELRRRIAGTNLPWRVLDTATQIEMLLIPPGTFQMGCSASQQYGCYSWENPVHTVTLTNALYMGRYEVTQAQWQARMGSNPSYFQSWSSQVPAAQVPDRPVEKVSWNTIQGFLVQTGMRLPTEAEWEYAYRAGTTTAFHGFTGYPSGTNYDTLVGNIAWYYVNSNSQTRPVGGKLANGYGLHDMSGNVWEWVSDWYGETYYSSSPQNNPTGPASGFYRVVRGGSWTNLSDILRASNRYNFTPDVAGSNIGFRVARAPF